MQVLKPLSETIIVIHLGFWIFCCRVSYFSPILEISDHQEHIFRGRNGKSVTNSSSATEMPDCGFSPISVIAAISLQWRHNGRDSVYLTVNSDADQRKHQSSASLAFVRGIDRSSVNSPHKWPVTRKMFPYDEVIMLEMTKGGQLSPNFHC